MKHLARAVARRGKSAIRVTAGNLERILSNPDAPPEGWPYNIRDLVDVHYVTLQVGELFDSRTDALRRIVRSRVKYANTIHPLIEPTWMLGKPPRSVAEWMTALRTPGAVTELGPLFSLARAGMQDGDKPFDVLRRFLATATDETILPAVDPRLKITWGEARAILEHHARIFSVQNLRTHRRAFSDWDQSIEDSFRSEIQGAGLVAEELPLVTVVLPAYNRQTLIADAIQSVIDQSYTNWELVVVDDGSTDTTTDVVEAFASKDSRIRLLRLNKVGVSRARNAGIAFGSGTVVAFIDSDNSWRADFLEMSVKAMTHFDVPVTYAAIERHEGNGHVQYVGLQAGRDYLLDGMSFIDLNVLVVKRSLLDETGVFDESLRRWVDYDLILRLLLNHSAKYLPIVGVDYSHEDETFSVNRITTSERSSWREVVLSKYLVDWSSAAPRVEGRISVLMHGRNNWNKALASVSGLLREADASGLDIEILIIDNASTRDFSSILAANFSGDSRVRIRREANDRKPALALNIAFAESTGSLVLFMSSSGVGQAGWLQRTLNHLTDDAKGVQALVLGEDGAVGEAGFVFDGEHSAPRSFLRGYPAEDLLRSGRTRFPAASARALLVRASDVTGLRGFRAHFGAEFFDVDLCLRMAAGADSFVLATDAIIFDSELRDDRVTGLDADAANALYELWKGSLPVMTLDKDYSAAGLTRTSWSMDSQVGLIPPARRFVSFPALRSAIPHFERVQGRPRRWAIKISSPSGPNGDAWGDTFFANDLRDSLVALGQEVIIDRVEGHFRRTRAIDDVVLTIRGLAKVPPQPGAFNILWVISHPDLVSDAEIASYDLVYAAGAEWARRATLRTGITVRPLLQATNPNRFHPALADPDSGDDVLFVGTPRKAMRPIVEHAIVAGHAPAIYGHGWEPYVDSKLVRADFVSPGEVGALYRSSGVVLNDHWSDMAEYGFLSNRLFDAAAAGARVISDPVPGLDEVFDGVIKTYNNVTELKGLLSRVSAIATPQEVDDLSARVRKDHTFDARAHTLLQDLEAALGEL